MTPTTLAELCDRETNKFYQTNSRTSARESFGVGFRRAAELMQGEIERLQCQLEDFAAKYRAIELANKEWSRVDAMSFGKLIEERDTLRTQADALAEALEFPFDIDCGDNSCRFARKKGGMRTNGGCRCANFFSTPDKVQDLLRHIISQQTSLASYRGKEE